MIIGAKVCMCMLFMRNFTTDMMSQSSFLLLDFESNKLSYILQYVIFFLQYYHNYFITQNEMRKFSISFGSYMKPL